MLYSADVCYFLKENGGGTWGRGEGGLREVEEGETVACNENKAKGHKYYHTGKGEASAFKSVDFYHFLT